MAKSLAFSGQSPRLPHLVRGGGQAGELRDTRSDVDSAFELLESRDTTLGYPEIDWLDGGAPAAAGGAAVIKGRKLLQAQTFAAVTIGASLEIIACTPGIAGNAYTVVVVDVTGGGLVVSMTANALEIDLGGATPDEDDIATALNNAGADNYQILRANSGGGAAFGVAAVASLVGGVGEGWECLVSGVVSPITHDVGAAVSAANLTETETSVTIPNLTSEVDARAAADLAQITIKSNNVMTQAMTVVLA